MPNAACRATDNCYSASKLLHLASVYEALADTLAWREASTVDKSGSARVPRVGACADKIYAYSSAIRAACANERSCGPVRGRSAMTALGFFFLAIDDLETNLPVERNQTKTT